MHSIFVIMSFEDYTMKEVLHAYHIHLICLELLKIEYFSSLPSSHNQNHLKNDERQGHWCLKLYTQIAVLILYCH